MSSENALIPEDVLTEIRNRNREYYSDPRGMGALKDLQQTFPNPWLYVAELLQNAVDERATRISAWVESDGSFVLEHNGTAFRESDVKALCMRGVSSKGAGTVGFMGIGFKSVFRSFECAQVSSGPWRFSLTVPVTKGERFGDNQRNWLGAVLPEWDQSINRPSDGMTCRFRLTRRLDELPPTEEDLERILGKDETLLALLAWQGVEELNWNKRRWMLEANESKLESDADFRSELTSLDESSASLRRWILFSKRYQPSEKAIARFLEHRQLTPSQEDQDKVYNEASQQRRVAVFCELDANGDPLPSERAFAFALLPTGVSLPFGLHVQADWLLVVSRRELMQIEGNSWHEEIFEQIPSLLANFLKWLVSSPRTLEGSWTRGYQVLTDRTSDKSEADEWFQRKSFRNLLKTTLLDLAFLPVPPLEEEGPVSFIAPSSARSLPQPLARMFGECPDEHNLLFGNSVFSSFLLGSGPLRFLEELQLILEIQPVDLEQHWNTGVLEKWLDLYEDDSKDATLSELHEALSRLDVYETWQNAKLPCIPTEGETWIHRADARRFPPDWDVFGPEEEIRTSLQPFIGDSAVLVRWSFDRYCQQTQRQCAFLSKTKSSKLEDVCGLWWDNIVANPSERLERLALRFTNWIRVKQPHRKKLVQRILAIANDKTKKFEETDEVLLASPYAGEFRKTWFPNLPVVAPDYEELDPNASLSDWRSFFESLGPEPFGKFKLNLTTALATLSELREMMGAGYNPPSRRVSYLSLSWKGHQLTSNDYMVIDAQLPILLKEKLEDGSNLASKECTDIAQWISESPGMLREYGKKKLVYIAFGEGSATECPMPQEASWVTSLREASWVLARNGDTPLCPAALLREEDPARPDAPVADLPSSLIRALEESGIRFGTALPDAPATDRLRIQGPSAAIEDVIVFLQDAIAEVGDDDEKRVYLQQVLAEHNFFPIPGGRESIDRVTRVPISRVVKFSRGRRSTFGNWLTSVDAFEEGSIERTLLESAGELVAIPDTTTLEQTISFLEWVWSTQPEADRVRNLLPRAYQYLRDDFASAPTDLQQKWENISRQAMVYIQGKRKWLPAASEDVFIDDINDNILLGAVSSVNLVTAGHLGEARDGQIETAKLINLKLVSERFRIDVLPIDELQVPHHWQEGFHAIQECLLGKLETTTETDEEDSSGASTIAPRLAISRWNRIETAVFDHDVKIDSKEVNAAIVDETVAVSGHPSTFAQQVAIILCDFWNLRRRHNLLELSTEAVIKLTQLDNRDVVSSWIETVEPDPTARTSEKQEREPSVEEPISDLDGEEVTEEDEPDTEYEVRTNDEHVSDAGNRTHRSYTRSVRQTGRDRGSEHGSQSRGNGSSDTGSSRNTEPGDRRGHTARDREGLINSLRRQLAELTSTGVSPQQTDDGEGGGRRRFHDDVKYRHAVIRYEKDHGRLAKAKSDDEPGHDIDSFFREKGSFQSKLLRRIEVKGKGVPWDEDEIVELSDRQFKDAQALFVEKEVPLHDDFDYWLYVVEERPDGDFHVLPIRNPAQRSAHYEFRGGTWKHMAEDPGIVQKESEG